MTNSTISRHQFTLRTLFALMTLTAILCASAPFIYRIWQSFDALATMFVAVVAPGALCALLVLATLPFAYRRAVSEIDRQSVDGIGASRSPAAPDHSEPNRTTNWRPVMVCIMVPLLLGLLGAVIGSSIGPDRESMSPQASPLQAAIGAALGLFFGMAYVAVLPWPERRA